MNMLRSVLALLFVCILTAYLPSSANAQTKVGGHLGYDMDSNEFFLGPNAVFETPIELGDKKLLINPEFSYYLVDDNSGFSNYSSSFWLLAVSALYPLNVEFGDAYVGAGLVMTHWSVSYDVDLGGIFSKNANTAAKFSESNNDFGLNGKFGVAFGKGSITPVAEAGFIISDSSWLYVQGGARYTL